MYVSPILKSRSRWNAVCGDTKRCIGLHFLSSTFIQRQSTTDRACASIFRHKQRKVGDLRKGVSPKGLEQPRHDHEGSERTSGRWILMRHTARRKAKQSHLDRSHLARTRLVSRNGHKPQRVQSWSVSARKITTLKKWDRTANYSPKKWGRKYCCCPKKWGYMAKFFDFSTPKNGDYLDIAIYTQALREGRSL